VTARRRVLFGRERFTAELDWAGLARLLPGWEVVASPPDQLTDHLDGVAAICPFGARVDRSVLDAGSFGLVHQYGVGLEKVDVPRATELGVWVSRIPGDAAGNADSVAELAVLYLLANLLRWADGGTPRWAVNAPEFCRWPRGQP
jgi:lactate dehydrogenase-like 2-hydroxyacid dehydrogenase